METKPTTRCALLELPAEMLNMIYRESLVSTSPIAIKIKPTEVDKTTYDHIDKSPESIARAIARKFPPPPLLQTCRQIRQEASSIYYGENIFEMRYSVEGHQYIGTSDALDGFLTYLGPEKRTLLGCVLVDAALRGDEGALRAMMDIKWKLLDMELEVPRSVLKTRVQVFLGKGKAKVVLMSEDEIRRKVQQREERRRKRQIKG